MNFTPLKDRIVVKRDEAPTEVNGLYIPNEAREKLNRGVVMAVGVDVKDVKVDDTIMFGNYDGTSIDLEGVNYLIMKENQVWCTL